jgi:hypothetical protein
VIDERGGQYMSDQNTFLVDGISAIAIHNGVVRVQFMRLGMDGKPRPIIELQVPTNSMKSVLDALKKVTVG